MKALTLWQPWATLVARGLKRYETRSWPTRYMGGLLIHAAKRRVRDYEIIRVLGRHRREFPDLLDSQAYPLGVVVARCELVTCVATAGTRGLVGDVELSCGDWSAGRWAWQLADIVALVSPVEARGRQGLWSPSAELIASCGARP